MTYAMTYDERILSFPRVDRTSLLTLDGRMEMPFRFGAYQAARWDRIWGQADLLNRNGMFYLACRVDAPEPMPNKPAEYLGVDVGIITLAATSDGELLDQTTGPKRAHVNQVRARVSRFRAKLQQKGTHSAIRALSKRSGRERRLARDVNHCLSTAIVSTAHGTSRGIALEDLNGIRERLAAKRTVSGKRLRRVLQSWAFFQLRAFIAYKSRAAGVRVMFVDPAHASQT